MIIVWKRKGWLVFLAFLLAVLIDGLLFDKAFPGIMENTFWSGAILALCFTVINSLFTIAFTGHEKAITPAEIDQIILERKTKFPNWKFGRVTIALIKVFNSRYSTFFLIRNKYYSYLGIIIFAYCAIRGLIYAI